MAAMTAMGDLVETWAGRLWLGLFGMLVVLIAAPAQARAPDVERDLCHSVSGTAPGDEALSRLRFSCRGTPKDSQQGSSGLRPSPDAAAPRRTRKRQIINSPVYPH